MSKCNRPYCDNEATESLGGRKKLCKQHAAERKARQQFTASLPNCLRCPNKARKDDHLCGACREAEDQLIAVRTEEMQARTNARKLDELMKRMNNLEEELKLYSDLFEEVKHKD